MNRFKSRARSLRGNQTAAEDILWQTLRGRQLARWKFRRQHPIARYIVDFVTLDGNLVVEVDGGTHATDAERARDDERTRASWSGLAFTSSESPTPMCTKTSMACS